MRAAVDARRRTTSPVRRSSRVSTASRPTSTDSCCRVVSTVASPTNRSATPPIHDTPSTIAQPDPFPRLDRRRTISSATAVIESSRPSCHDRNDSTSTPSATRIRRRLADAVTRPTRLPQQHRPLVLVRRRVLQQRRHLARVQRVDAGVALGRREQHRRVRAPSAHVVVRRVGVQPAELLGDVGVAVLVGPQPGDQELREADHVEQRHRAPHRPGQVGPLRERRTHQQAAVRAADQTEPVAATPCPCATSQSPAAWKSSNTFCLLPRRPA